MTRNDIRAILKRAKFRLVKGGQEKSKLTEVNITMAVGALSLMSNPAPKSLQSISYRTRSPKGLVVDIALSDVIWPPLKSYHNSVEAPLTEKNGPQEETELDRLQRENAALKRQNDLFWNIIVRLRNEIRFQVTFWENGFKYNEWLSSDTMKRKLSGLRGALQYMREFYPNKKLPDEEG